MGIILSSINEMKKPLRNAWIVFSVQMVYFMWIMCRYNNYTSEIIRLPYLMPTTVLKSSSNDLLMYFRKLNLVPGDKWAYTNICQKLDPMAGINSKSEATYSNESMPQSKVVCPSNRSKELSKEAHLQFTSSTSIASNELRRN